ncbi:Uncharacterized protein SCF082_LOCUS42568 [Durusdinium trenchii]|uniref:Uncharacterized protein n=2 Tax=Durusdinium trenchii TaxID=1381693 RepID=A0ABP0QPP8_9DINO
MPIPALPSNLDEERDEPLKSIEIGSDSNELTQLQQRLEAELEKLAVRLRTVEERLGVEPEKPTSEMAEDQLTPVPVEESAWSIPLVIGLDNTGWLDTLAAVVLVMVNLGMQLAFSGILLSEEFMGDAFESHLEFAKIWRTSVAHDYSFLDLAGASLVTRVCNLDGALIYSQKQSTLVEEINAFLGLGKDELRLPILQVGTLLCMLCILLWCLCVYKELRRIWLAFEATLQIPRAKKSRMQNHCFHALSGCRFGMLLMTYIARTAIASVLLVAGILWLARTTSITELMLNAVALNAILDVDEFLFIGMTPIKIQHTIKSLEPIKVNYSHRRSQRETAVHFTLITITVLLSYSFLVVPLTNNMLAVKTELCGGNRTFVVAYNPETQTTFGLVTAQSRGLESNLSASEMAVKSHIGTTPEMVPGPIPDYIFFSHSRKVFDLDRTRSMAEEASLYPVCMEKDIMQETGTLHGDPTMTPLVQTLLRNAGLVFGRQMAASCQELVEFCDLPEAQLLRLVCGDTCGCTSPLSSPWHKTKDQGFSVSCLLEANWRKKDVSCEDDESRGWADFWHNYAPAVSFFYGRDVTQTILWSYQSQVLELMLSQGCSLLHNFTLSIDQILGVPYCEGQPTLFQPLATICPQSCGCTATPTPSHCPSRCASR